jgi:hypothetical protein
VSLAKDEAYLNENISPFPPYLAKQVSYYSTVLKDSAEQANSRIAAKTQIFDF